MGKGEENKRALQSPSQSLPLRPGPRLLTRKRNSDEASSQVSETEGSICKAPTQVPGAAPTRLLHEGRHGDGRGGQGASLPALPTLPSATTRTASSTIRRFFGSAAHSPAQAPSQPASQPASKARPTPIQPKITAGAFKRQHPLASQKMSRAKPRLLRVGFAPID